MRSMRLILSSRLDHPPELVKRLPVKLHHCHDSRAKDTNIRQAPRLVASDKVHAAVLDGGGRWVLGVSNAADTGT